MEREWKRVKESERERQRENEREGRDSWFTADTVLERKRERNGKGGKKR